MIDFPAIKNLSDTSLKTDNFGLTPLQTLNAKVIATDIAKNTLLLELSIPNHANTDTNSTIIQVSSSVQSNYHTEQILKLVVTRLKPNLELQIKPTSTTTNKTELPPPTLLRQIPFPTSQLPSKISAPTNTTHQQPISHLTSADSSKITASDLLKQPSKPTIQLHATIVAINKESIQIDIPKSHLASTPPHLNEAIKSALQKTNHSDSVSNVSDSKSRITIPLSNLAINYKAFSLPAIEHPTTNQLKSTAHPFDSSPQDLLKRGQKVILDIEPKPHQSLFRLTTISDSLDLKPSQIITAKVIKITKHQIQLQFSDNSQSSSTKTSLPKQAQVLSIDKNQLVLPNLAKAQKQPVDAPSSSLLKPQSLIQLQVLKTFPQPEFKLVIENDFPLSQQKIMETVKHLLPIQQPPEIAIQQLLQPMLKQTENNTVSVALKRAAKQIMNNLAHLDDITTKNQLKTLIKSSGIFFETNLSHHPEQLQSPSLQDLKHQLLTFSNHLKKVIQSRQTLNSSSVSLETLQTLQSKTEQSLARIVLNQLNSLPVEESTTQAWILDLPFLQKDNTVQSIRIEIKQNKKRHQKKQPDHWSVNLTLSPPHLGTLQCNINCVDEIVNTQFLSIDSNVTHLIEKNLARLRDQLQQAGLKTGKLSAIHGKQSIPSEKIIVHENLLDQKV